MSDRSTARFERVELIGKGGMGEVYRARDRDGSWVALKCIRDATPLATVRFLREARVLESLSHKNIVRLIASGQDDGQPWIVTELLEGQPLDRWLQAERRSERAALSIVAQLCSALSHAHERGIIHRDVKPSNVFVCADGTVKLLDFGVARVAEARRLTASGQVIGTWDYLSPEQARGDSALDARSDLFSLGSLLYEVLTGRTPFAAETPQGTLYAILFQAPLPASVLRPSITPAVQALLARLLEKNPADRFVDAAAARAEIEALIERASDTASAAMDATVIDAKSRTAATVERRLLVLVHCSALKDPVFIEATAAQLGAVARPLVDRSTVVLFGAGHWRGDEPQRALRFASLARTAAARVVIAAVRADWQDPRDCARVMDEAVAVSEGEGVFATPSAAALLRGFVQLHGESGASQRVEPLAPSVAQDTEISPFVGRIAERALLQQCFERVRDSGLSESAFVIGAPGFGKSRLLREALSTARIAGGATSLVLRGEPLRSTVAFGSLRAALEEREPGLLAALDAATSMADPSEAAERVKSVVALALRASDTAVLLAVDDAEWIDAPTRAVIVRLLADQALSLCLWVFSGPEGARAWDGLVRWAARVELDLLPSDACVALVDALCPSISLERRRAIAEKSAGHPLCAESLCAIAVAGALDDGAVPPDAEAAMLVQLDLCREPTRDALKRAAIVGCTFWTDAVTTLGGAADTLPDARRARIIAPHRATRLAGESEHRFRSPVLAAVAASLFTEDARAALHRATAQWLERHPDADPAEIAAHFDLASAPTLAAPAHAKAAERLARAGALEDAERHATRALASAPDAECRFRAWSALDECRFASGTHSSRREASDALVALSSSMSDARRAEAAWRACREARLCSDHDRAMAMATLATSFEASTDAAPWAANAWIDRSTLDAREGRGDEARAAARRAVELATRIGDPWLFARASAACAVAIEASGEQDGIVEAYERASQLFARCGDGRRAAAMSYNAAACALDRGRLVEARAALEAALSLARASRNVRTAAAAQHSLGVIARCEGDLRGAVELQRASEAQALALSHHALVAACVSERAYLAIQGAIDEDRGSLARALIESAQVARVRSAALVAQALSLRLGLAGDDAVASVEAATSAARGALAIELSAALYAFDPNDRRRAALEDALAKWLDDAPDTDRDTGRAALARRYAIALYTAPATGIADAQADQGL
ncbi:MAG: protein kinase [Polyangiales bacterium]